MSFEVIRKSGEVSFVDNPIAFEVKTTGETEIQIRLDVGGEAVFAASYIPFKDRVYFDIAEVLRPFVSSTPLREGTDLVLPVAGFAVGYSLEVKAGEAQTVTGQAICGGISKQAARDLAGRGMDFILNRLRDYSGQFLFTTRTGGRHIAVRETEISPLIFIHPGKQIQAECEYGDRITLPAGVAGEIYALNIERIRRAFFDEYGRIAAFIRILVEGQYAFDISFTPGEISGGALALLFRNSLGCYETVEMPGEMTRTLDSEDESYQAFDEQTGDYTTKRPKPGFRQKMQINTGFKRKAELEFIRDLLSSQDVWLLTGNTRRRVLVTCEEYGYKEPMKEPTSLVLDVEVAEKESNYTPDMEGEGGIPFIELLPEQAEIPAGGGEVKVQVKSNIMWEVV